MGRPQKGWRLRKRRDRPYSVRFTVDGTEAELGLGTYDRAEAEDLASKVYSDAIRGVRRVARAAPSRGKALAEVAGEWLTALASTLDPETRATYALYAETHWAPRWATLEAISTPSVADYQRARLRQVSASTVRKESSALRGLLLWAVERGILPVSPSIPGVPKRALGTAHKQARRGAPVELAPAEVAAILKALPKVDRFRFPIRAYFTTLYETGLRPGTVEALSVPEHWRPGATTLTIPRALDKARDGRPVPLSARAVKALESAAQTSGVIFGAVDLRVSLRAAALEVIGKDRARRLTPYDLRRARLTHWTEESSNLPGVMHLAGHKSLNTTAKYVRGSERAAREVLKKRRT